MLGWHTPPKSIHNFVHPIQLIYPKKQSWMFASNPTKEWNNPSTKHHGHPKSPIQSLDPRTPIHTLVAHTEHGAAASASCFLWLTNRKSQVDAKKNLRSSGPRFITRSVSFSKSRSIWKKTWEKSFGKNLHQVSRVMFVSMFRKKTTEFWVVITW